MRLRLLLVLCWTGHIFAEKPPDVDCTVIHLKYVECLWKSLDVNYTFYSAFTRQSFRECDTYIVKDGLNVGCQQFEDDLKSKRFLTFKTRLEHGGQSWITKHKLITKVKLYPPTNFTVQLKPTGLCFEWKQIFTDCVESEVRYRVNENKWEPTFQWRRSEYCINLPSNSSRYELQVRSRVSDNCGQSEEWSNWSQPVVWGTHNITAQFSRLPEGPPPPLWEPLVYSVGGVTLLVLLIMLLHHQRIRIILIPVVPKPSLVPHDLKEWLDSSKGLKEVFKTNYMERTCSVREYCPVSTSDSNSYNSSDISVSTDQTNCSGPVPSRDPNEPRSSSTDELVPSEEQHISV